MIRLSLAIVAAGFLLQGCHPAWTARAEAPAARESACGTGLLLHDDFEYDSDELTDQGWFLTEGRENCTIEDGFLLDGPPSEFCEMRQPICVDAIHAEFEMRVGLQCNYNCSALLKLFDEQDEIHDIAGDGSVLSLGPHWRREIYHGYHDIDAAVLVAPNTETRLALDTSGVMGPKFATHTVEYRDGLISYRVDDDLLLDALRVSEPGTRLQASEVGIFTNTTNGWPEIYVDWVEYTVHE